MRHVADDLAQFLLPYIVINVIKKGSDEDRNVHMSYEHFSEHPSQAVLDEIVTVLQGKDEEMEAVTPDGKRTKRVSSLPRHMP